MCINEDRKVYTDMENRCHLPEKREIVAPVFLFICQLYFPLFGSENADMFSYVFFKECIVKFFIVKYASEKLVSEPFCIQQKSICYMNRLP